MTEPLESELIWAAALFVGEGCIINRRRQNVRSGAYPLSLKISMYDQRAMQRFLDAIQPCITERKNYHKVQSIRLYERKQKRPNGEVRIVYVCDLGTHLAWQACKALYPHLKGTDKGDQMELACKKALVELE